MAMSFLTVAPRILDDDECGLAALSVPCHPRGSRAICTHERWRCLRAAENARCS